MTNREVAKEGEKETGGCNNSYFLCQASYQDPRLSPSTQYLDKLAVIFHQLQWLFKKKKFKLDVLNTATVLSPQQNTNGGVAFGSRVAH